MRQIVVQYATKTSVMSKLEATSAHSLRMDFNVLCAVVNEIRSVCVFIDSGVSMKE